MVLEEASDPLRERQAHYFLCYRMPLTALAILFAMKGRKALIYNHVEASNDTQEQREERYRRSGKLESASDDVIT